MRRRRPLAEPQRLTHLFAEPVPFTFADRIAAMKFRLDRIDAQAPLDCSQPGLECRPLLDCLDPPSDRIDFKFTKSPK
jgi:hypothetical protein